MKHAAQPFIWLCSIRLFAIGRKRSSRIHNSYLPFGSNDYSQNSKFLSPLWVERLFAKFKILISPLGRTIIRRANFHNSLHGAKRRYELPNTHLNSSPNLGEVPKGRRGLLTPKVNQDFVCLLSNRGLQNKPRLRLFVMGRNGDTSCSLPSGYPK